MKRYLMITALAAILATPLSHAEQWTLDRCIDYALEHNLTVRSRSYDIERGRVQERSAKDAFLPTLNASAGQNWSFGRSVAEDNIKVSSNASSFSWNASAQLPLFDGLRNYRALQGARLNLSDLVLRQEMAKDDITLNVIAAYLQALLNEELVGVAQTQLDMSRVEAERQATLVEAGKVPELDLIQARSRVAQDEMSLVTAQNDYALSLLDLRQLLLLPPDTDVTPAPLPSQMVLIPTADEVYRNAMGYNSTILSRRQNLLIADNKIDQAKTGWMPTLSFGASVGSSYTRFNTLPSASFGSQMRNNLTEGVGFSLSIPIFDGFSTRNSISTAKIARMQADIDLEQASADLYRTISQAYLQAESARKKAEAGDVAQQATKAALDAMTTKYNYGRATYTEYEQARTDYIRAVSTTLQARYEYIIRAKILEFYNTPHGMH